MATGRPRMLLVSFDALGTLIEVAGGVGHQYLNALQNFLASRRPPLPPVRTSAGAVNAAAMDAIRAEMSVDRAAWAEAEMSRMSRDGSAATVHVNPKEMPLGGPTTQTAFHFWRRVLHRTYRDPRVALPHSADGRESDGSAAHSTQRGPHLGIPEADWEAFYAHVIDDVFGTAKPYAWLPDALHTLQQLAEWNRTHAAHAHAQLICPPFVVSNSDRYLQNVFADLGALSGSPPLISAVIVARDVGRGKPSPLGLERSVELAGCTSDEQRRDLVHVHVGDDEVDRLACEAAAHRCHHVPCDVKHGVRWDTLRAKLEEVGRIA